MAKRDSLQPGQPLAATGTSAEDWQLVFDELAAAVGEDGRTAGETCPVLLAMVGREPSDAAAVCQHVGTDSWAVASVGIAEAAAPKNTILLSPRNGEVSQKAGSGSCGDRLSGSGKGRLGLGGTIWEKILCSEGPTGGKQEYTPNRREAKKLIPDKRTK